MRNPALVGKIILARFLECSVKNFLAFVRNTEESPVFKRLVEFGAITFESQPVLTDPELKILANSGAVAFIDGSECLKYTAQEFCTKYETHRCVLEEFRKGTTIVDIHLIDDILYKLKRINTRNLILHEMLMKIIEFQREYFVSGNEWSLKPLSRSMLAECIVQESGLPLVDKTRVSRAARNLFIVMRGQKKVSLTFFFRSKKNIAKKAIQAIIAQEQKEMGSGKRIQAYTDERLKSILENNYGISSSRRQVACCRKELGLLPYPERSGYLYHAKAANHSEIFPLTAASVVRHAPEISGVYELCTDKPIVYPCGFSGIFYIGSAKNLRKRLLSHLSSNRNGGVTRLLKERTCSFRFFKVTERWDIQEKQFYDRFLSTFGESPIFNRMSPRIIKRQLVTSG